MNVTLCVGSYRQEVTLQALPHVGDTLIMHFPRPNTDYRVSGVTHALSTTHQITVWCTPKEDRLFDPIQFRGIE